MSNNNHTSFTGSLLSIGLSLVSIFSAMGQNSSQHINQGYENSYYQQKVSLFQLLPQSTEDIIFLGNSITDIGEWTELWQNLDIKNRGISSDITAGVLARLDHIIQGQPSKLFIMIGINDIARNIPAEIITYNYKEILQAVVKGSPSTKVYVQSILPTNNEFTEYKNHQNKLDQISTINSELRQICMQLSANLTYIDLNPLFSDKEGKLKKEYTNDGLHLNGAGYLLWKKLLVEGGYCCD